MVRQIVFNTQLIKYNGRLIKYDFYLIKSKSLNSAQVTENNVNTHYLITLIMKIGVAYIWDFLARKLRNVTNVTLYNKCYIAPYTHSLYIDYIGTS